MDPGGTARASSERNLEIARRLLATRDLVGCKSFAERAIASDPLSVDPAVDQLLAAADVLLAASNTSNPDPYAVLGLPPRSPSSSVLSSFRRLSLLLRSPSPSTYSAVSDALRLVSDAYAALFDPSKKSRPDSDVSKNVQDDAFWTSCPACCRVHQYDRAYIDQNLRCPTCGQPFRASELAAPPPIVPGTDLYFCSWGFFPLGFSAEPANDGKPFIPLFHEQQPGMSSQARSNVRHFKKAVTKKKAGGGVADPKEAEVLPAKPVSNIHINEEEDGSQAKPVRIDINEEVQGEDCGIPNISIDLDATEELFGNLPNFEF